MPSRKAAAAPLLQSLSPTLTGPRRARCRVRFPLGSGSDVGKSLRTPPGKNPSFTGGLPAYYTGSTVKGHIQHCYGRERLHNCASKSCPVASSASQQKMTYNFCARPKACPNRELRCVVRTNQNTAYTAVRALSFDEAIGAKV